MAFSCAVQRRGRSIRSVKTSAVCSGGWSPAAIASTISGLGSFGAALRHDACLRTMVLVNLDEWRLMTAREQNTILIVDDDGDVREALSRFLKGNGYRVRCAENGRLHLMKSENGGSRRK